MPFSCVINSFRCAINWTSVCIVLYCCVQLSQFIPSKKKSRTALNFRFRLKNTASESYGLLQEGYGDRWFWRLKSDNFDVAGKEHKKLPKKYYEEVDTKRYQQHLINLNRLLPEKRLNTERETTQSHSSSWHLYIL